MREPPTRYTHPNPNPDPNPYSLSHTLTHMQERYWPDKLDHMRKNLEYDHVLLKSDYWKKFEGTVLKQGTPHPH